MKKLTPIILSILTVTGMLGGVSATEESKVLRIGISYAPSGINLWQTGGYSEDLVRNAIFAPLYHLTKDGGLIPDLASGQPIVENGVWKIRLRDGLQFSNGDPLTADDVIFTYKAHMTPILRSLNYYRLSGFLESNDSVVKINDTTIEFHPRYSGLDFAPILTIGILPEEVYGAGYDQCLSSSSSCYLKDDLTSVPIGAGPYILEKLPYSNQDMVELTRNDKYWDMSNVFYDKLELVPSYTEDGIALFNNGSLNLLSPNFAYVNTINEYNVTYVDGQVSIMFMLNHNHPYYGTGELVPDNGSKIVSTDDRVQARFIRKAMDYLINRTFVAKENFEGMAMEGEIILPPSAIGRSLMDYRNYSVEMARSMMEKAGFDYATLGNPDGEGKYQKFFFNITILAPSTCPARNLYHRVFGEELKKIGIGVKEYVEAGWNVIVPRTFGYGNASVPVYDEGGFDFLPLGISMDKFVSTISWVYSGDNDYLRQDNFISYSNATLNGHIDTAMNTTDLETYSNEVQAIEKILYDDLPVLTIVYPKSGVAIDNKTHIDPEDFAWASVDWREVYDRTYSPPTSETGTSESTTSSPAGTTGSGVSSTSEKSGLTFMIAIIALPTILFKRRRGVGKIVPICLNK